MSFRDFRSITVARSIAPVLRCSVVVLVLTADNWLVQAIVQMLLNNMKSYKRKVVVRHHIARLRCILRNHTTSTFSFVHCLRVVVGFRNKVHCTIVHWNTPGSKHFALGV